VDERVDDAVKRRPDDDTNSQVDDIATQRKVTELSPHQTNAPHPTTAELTGVRLPCLRTDLHQHRLVTADAAVRARAALVRKLGNQLRVLRPGALAALTDRACAGRLGDVYVA